MIIKILVNKGDQVENGKVVAIMEAMKMENDILAIGNGMIKSINVKEGDSINWGQDLPSYEAPVGSRSSWLGDFAP